MTIFRCVDNCRLILLNGLSNLSSSVRMPVKDVPAEHLSPIDEYLADQDIVDLCSMLRRERSALYSALGLNADEAEELTQIETRVIGFKIEPSPREKITLKDLIAKLRKNVAGLTLAKE